MRSGHARCPTYLVAGLLVMSFLLICNWWSLSSQNYELLKEMDDMGTQLSLCFDNKLTCSSKLNAVEIQARDIETKYRTLESNHAEELSSLKSEVSELDKSLKNSKRDLGYCQTELDSLKKVDLSKQATLESMRVEKESLAMQLTKAKEEAVNLNVLLKQANAANVVKLQEAPVAPPKDAPSIITEKKSVGVESQDVLPYPSINDGPVNDGNHEINKDIETALENAANEEIDDNPEQETGKRPPIKQ